MSRSTSRPAPHRFGGPVRVQSLLFDRRRFTPQTARSWASANGYRAPATEETAHSWVLRQEVAGNFVEGTFRTLTLEPGVIAMVAEPKRGVGPAPEKEPGMKDVWREAVSDVRAGWAETKKAARSAKRAVAKTTRRARKALSGKKKRR